MKRLICLALAFVFFLTTFAILTPCVNEEKKLESASLISTQINTLVEKYESRQDTQNRLIVNSNKLNESYGAVAVIKARNFQILQFDSLQKCESAKRQIDKLGISCENDSFAYVEARSKAPSKKDMWAIKNVQSDVANEFLSSNGSYKEVIVAVMDTGINASHELFKNRIVVCNKNFSSTGQQNCSDDDNGHGTSVAGIVALNTLDNVKIKPYKTFDSDGKCTNSQIIATLNYILSEKKLPDVINMSFSIQSIASSITRDSITRQLISRGVTIVTSAGNKGVNAKYYYPANISEVITVSASNKKNEKADFSNYGNCVELAAPGTGIYTSDKDGTYTYQNGTSFSASFVSAAAATLLMQEGSLNCYQVKDRLCNAAVPVYNEIMQYAWCGAGVVNFSGIICGAKIEAPSFSVDQGKYNEPFELEIKSNSGEKIMYTLDNTIPTAKNGIEYAKPIEIDDDTHIIAVAYEEAKKSMYTASTYEIVYNGSETDFEVSDNGVLTSYNGDKTNITVPEIVDGITVVAVGDNVFNSSNLKSIVLPYTVKRIGVSAFANSKLTSITANGVIDIDNGAFEGCESLVSLNMQSVKTIGNRCFKNCKLLTEVEFDQTVCEIGDNSFSFTSLSSAEFPNVTSAASAFEGTKIVVADLPLVKSTYRTFADCSLLASVNMPSLEDVGNFTFYGCTSLNNINLGGVKSVGASAFKSSAITAASLPECEFVGRQAFYDCKNMTSVSLPKLKTLCDNTFSYCCNLKNINIDNLEKFDDVNEHYFTDCISLTGLYLPHCINLANVSWSSSMLSNIAFGTKPKLSFVFAPNAVEVAGSSDAPFAYKCSKLKYAVLTSAKEIKNIENINSSVWYFNSCVENLPNKSLDITVVAPDSSVAIKWAKANDVDFVLSSQLNLTAVSSSELIYEVGGKEYKLPTKYVKSLWNTKLINSQSGENTVAALLDFNNDSTINVKDYVLINKA